jgi:hypothetical protein
MRIKYERTSEYSPILMEKNYLIRSGLKKYLWFRSFEDAHKYWITENHDYRFAYQGIISPIKMYLNY